VTETPSPIQRCTVQFGSLPPRWDRSPAACTRRFGRGRLIPKGSTALRPFLLGAVSRRVSAARPGDPSAGAPPSCSCAREHGLTRRPGCFWDAPEHVMLAPLADRFRTRPVSQQVLLLAEMIWYRRDPQKKTCVQGF
jgi:hypothetical protein